MPPHFPTACGAAVALACACGSVVAADPADAPRASAAESLVATVATAGSEPSPVERPSSVPLAAAPSSWWPLEATELDALRGGDSVENHVDIDGEVTGNTADHITSGDNAVRGDALGNAAGIITLIQNSGSNVLIQNGMTVNVQFAPPP